jgi:hypothetical protein
LVRQHPDIEPIVRGKRAERIGYAVERLDDLACMAGERVTCSGRDNSRVLAYEQRDAETGFEIPDAFARRRRDDVLAVRGACDAPVVDRADEELERGEVESHGAVLSGIEEEEYSQRPGHAGRVSRVGCFEDSAEVPRFQTFRRRIFGIFRRTGILGGGPEVR